jgi:glycosyltransferase involved in cell wall biosynthesis
LRALIVGRGTHRETLAIRPVEKMGLADVIRFTGYVREGYLETLAAFDALLFLRAGSDATGRALREVLAIGRPAIVSDHGMLAELVQDGRTGFVVPLDARAAAQKLVELAREPEWAATPPRTPGSASIWADRSTPWSGRTPLVSPSDFHRMTRAFRKDAGCGGWPLRHY